MDSLLNKEFSANGISLRVETRITLLDKKHLIDKTVKFSLAFFLRMRNWFSFRRLVSHGLSKSVYRSQSSYVQQYVDGGVER